MRKKTVFRRRVANDDIEAAIAYYLEEAGIKTAMDFANRLEETLNNISEHPAIGSPRYAHAFNIPKLRYLPMVRFPYLIFYTETDDRIEVSRVLHFKMDITSRFETDEAQ